jgi:hypothetical protein
MEQRMPERHEQFRRTRSLVIVLSLVLPAVVPDFCFAEKTVITPAPPESYSSPYVCQIQMTASAVPLQAAESSMPDQPELAPEFTAPDISTSGYMKAIDTAHARLERSILNQAIRFDNFFGDVHTDNLRQTKFELRWRNSFRIEHAWDVTNGTSIRANFVLSKISERLRLVIAGEDEPNQTQQALPKDPGNPGFDRTTPSAHFANTELRYELVQKPDVNLFLGAGVRIALPFEVFVRSRFQYTYHLSDITLMRTAETFFAKNTDLLGETTEFSIERLFGKSTIVRWASAGTASEEIEGIEWGTELSLLQELSPKSAFTLTGGLYGVSSTAGLVSNYRILARYRRNFLRDWLFYELEPEVNWPRDQWGSYSPVYAFTFRFEVVFQGAAADRVGTGTVTSSVDPGCPPPR